MAYKNFVPTIWAKEIQTELERACVFAEDTNRQFEGEVKEMGDTVRILGVGKPKITTQTGGDITLPGAEAVADTSVTMPINTVSYFDYLVGDIDKLQAQGGIMEALSKESSEGVANEMDKFIANLALDKTAIRADNTATQITTDNVLSYIDKQLEKLYDNDVKPNSKITLTGTPWFYTIFKQAYLKLDTNNSEALKNGKVAMYGNVSIKMSNNVAKDTNGNSLIQLKTDKAIAFACPKIHTEPYRPQNKFADAVKGYVLYGGKVVRPKEMIILNCKA